MGNFISGWSPGKIDRYKLTSHQKTLRKDLEHFATAGFVTLLMSFVLACGLRSVKLFIINLFSDVMCNLG